MCFSFSPQNDEFCLKINIDSIAVADIPNMGIGLAINDRLARAAEYNGTQKLDC